MDGKARDVGIAPAQDAQQVDGQYSVELLRAPALPPSFRQVCRGARTASPRSSANLPTLPRSHAPRPLAAATL